MKTSTTYTHNGAALQSVKSTASTSVELPVDDEGTNLSIALQDDRTLQYNTSAGVLSTYTGKATVTTNISKALGITGFDTMSAGLTANLSGQTKTLTATLNALPGLALEVTLGDGDYPTLKANGTRITSRYTASKPWKSKITSITRSYLDEDGKTKTDTIYMQYLFYLDSQTITTVDDDNNEVTKTVPVLMFDTGYAYDDATADPEFTGKPTPISLNGYDADEIQEMLQQIQEGTRSGYEAYPTLSRLLLQGTLANS